MAGVKISRITSLADDIALNLAVADVRMEAPIPGKPAVGIEVPNHKAQCRVYPQRVREPELSAHDFAFGHCAGQGHCGVAQVADLCKMPHLLIAGSTGSGKSVCVNSIIMSIVFRSSPEDVKLHAHRPQGRGAGRVSTASPICSCRWSPSRKRRRCSEQRRAGDGAPLPTVCEKQCARHQVLQQAGGQRPDLEKMPYIAIIIDELADLMMVVGKDVEDSICRIARRPAPPECTSSCHPAPQRGRHHWPDQGQHPQPHRLCCVQPGGQPYHSGWCRCENCWARAICCYACGRPKPRAIQGTFVRDEEISRVLDFIKPAPPSSTTRP